MSCIIRVVCHGLSVLIFASLASSLLAQEKTDWGFHEKNDRVEVTFQGQPIANFVFHDDLTRRPYLCQVKTQSGIQVTRNHPPVAGQDAVDHDTMHPGIWLGFGDISGVDFWRNKGTIRHVRFVQSPQVADGRLTFETESQLLDGDNRLIGSVNSTLTFIADDLNWMVLWKAAFHAKNQALVFGDQEEMGFGARVATAITEKNGGAILSSTGKRTAKDTWGQPADWCDYSGTIDGTPSGITLMSGPSNFRQSWWHNRDYGVFVANPFGRKAMGQGDMSSVVVEPGKTLSVTFGAVIHEEPEFNAKQAYDVFRKQSIE